MAALGGAYVAHARSRKGHDPRPLVALAIAAALAAVVVGIAWT